MSDTVIKNLKELHVVVGSAVLRGHCKAMATAMANGVNLTKECAISRAEELKPFFILFKESAPVQLSTESGLPVPFTLNINQELKVTDYFASLHTKLALNQLQTLVTDEVKGTHLEVYCSDPSEMEAVIASGVKAAMAYFKKGFKVWSDLLSAEYEKDYNLLLESSILAGNMCIIGLYVKGSDQAKSVEFYINPEFVANKMNNDSKSFESLERKALTISADINCITNPAVRATVANRIQGTIARTKGMVSAVKSVVASCKDVSKLIEAPKKDSE